MNRSEKGTFLTGRNDHNSVIERMPDVSGRTDTSFYIRTGKALKPHLVADSRTYYNEIRSNYSYINHLLISEAEISPNFRFSLRMHAFINKAERVVSWQTDCTAVLFKPA